MDPRTVTPPPLGGPLDLRPFAGSMLRPNLIGDPSAPRLFARSLRGVAGQFDHWQRRGRLTTDATPALYVHEYTQDGITIRGIVGLMALTERAAHHSDAAVVPHEDIHPLQADVLADRMAQGQVQPAPILLVHQAPPDLRGLVRRIAAEPPSRQYADGGGQRHRLWTVRDRAQTEAIQEALSPSHAVIADGHHRYAAYLRLQARYPGSDFDYGLAMLVDQADTPFHLGAIHRVLDKITLEDVQMAATAIGGHLDFRPTPIRPEHHQIVATARGRWAVVTIPQELHQTEVEALHRRLIPALPRGPWGIDYRHDPDEASAATEHRAGTAILLPPPDWSDILHSALAGHTLPEKATSFQPKPHIGTLMRHLQKP